MVRASVIPLLLAGCPPADKSPAGETGVAADTARTAPPDTGTDTASEADSEQDTAEPPPAFALERRIEQGADSALQLRTNLPSDVADCEALPYRDPPCADSDLDGLVDAWEEAALAGFSPQVRLDEAEPLLVDPAAALAGIGRVAARESGTILVIVVLAYSEDYGRCGISGHNGDSERVALELAPLEGGAAGEVVVAQAYTAAHEGTINDHGAWFAAEDLASLTIEPDPASGEPRWVVYASDGKHATYGTIDLCEGASWIPCLEEDCAPDGMETAAGYDRLPAVTNAGEPDAPLLGDLSALGFPGEDPWIEQDFCGGLGADGGCSAPLIDKLTADPF